MASYAENLNKELLDLHRIQENNRPGARWDLQLDAYDDLDQAVFMAIANAYGPSGAPREVIQSYAGQLIRWIRMRMIEVPYKPPEQAKE